MSANVAASTTRFLGTFAAFQPIYCAVLHNTLRHGRDLTAPRAQRETGLESNAPAAWGTYFVPLPCAGTTCGLPRAASNIFTLPYWWPTAAGVKVTVIVQELPAPKMPTQLSISPNSAALNPLTAIEVILRATVSGLVSVIGNALLLPFATLPKNSTVGERGSLPLTP
jgi:hypothetical protein